MRWTDYGITLDFSGICWACVFFWEFAGCEGGVASGGMVDVSVGVVGYVVVVASAFAYFGICGVFCWPEGNLTPLVDAFCKRVSYLLVGAFAKRAYQNELTNFIPFRIYIANTDIPLLF